MHTFESKNLISGTAFCQMVKQMHKHIFIKMLIAVLFGNAKQLKYSIENRLKEVMILSYTVLPLQTRTEPKSFQWKYINDIYLSKNR